MLIFLFVLLQYFIFDDIMRFGYNFDNFAMLIITNTCGSAVETYPAQKWKRPATKRIQVASCTIYNGSGNTDYFHFLQ